MDRQVVKAVEAVNQGRVREGEEILERALDRCPDHLGVLRELAGLRFRQTRWVDAEALALRAASRAPDAEWPWDVAGSSRYLAQDRTGALKMWNHIGRPRVRNVELRWADTQRTAPSRHLGLTPGDILTPGHLARAERRLMLTPAVTRARVDYRPLPGGGAQVDGHLLAGPRHPLVRSEWPGHLARALTRSFSLVGMAPGGAAVQVRAAGHYGGWGQEVRTGVQHSLPLSHGAVDWSISWAATELPLADTVGRWERTSAAVGLRRWETSTVQTHLQFGADRWDREDLMIRAGGGLLVAGRGDSPTWIGAAAQGWRDAQGDRHFGRVSVATQGAWGQQWQLEVRSGADFLSSQAPVHLGPRFGADPSVDHLLRSRQVVRLSESPGGGRWIHGGAELRRWWSAGTTLHLGFGIFGEGVTGAVRGGALGAGVRLRPRGSGSWIRADWASDPSTGGHRFSLGMASTCGLGRHLPFSLPPCTVTP